MNRSWQTPLAIALAFCCGVVAGGALAKPLLQAQSCAAVAGTASLEEQVAVLTSSTIALSEEIKRIEGLVKVSISRMGDNGPSKRGQREPVPPAINPDGIESNEGRSRLGGERDLHSAWVTVLDEDIARVLVELGLTPFDKGVSSLVKEAADSLRRADRVYEQAIYSMTEAYKSKGILDDEYDRFRTPHFDLRNETRNTVIGDLRRALDGLCRQPDSTRSSSPR